MGKAYSKPNQPASAQLQSNGGTNQGQGGLCSWARSRETLNALSLAQTDEYTKMHPPGSGLRVRHPKANSPGSNSSLKEQKGHRIFDIHSLGHSSLQTLLAVLLLMNGFFFGTVSSHNYVIFFFFFLFWSSYLLIWCSNNDSVSERTARRRVIQFSYYTPFILEKHLNLNISF